VDLHGRKPWRAADDLAGMPAATLEENLGNHSDTGKVERPLARIDRRLELSQALRLHRLRYLIVARGGRGSGAGAVFEGECRGVADVCDDSQRLGEIVVAFAGKSDDEIAGKCDIGPRRANLLDSAEVVGARVTPVHRGEHPVGPRLYRQVQVRHERVEVA